MLQPEINQNQTQLEHSKLTLTSVHALGHDPPARELLPLAVAQRAHAHRGPFAALQDFAAQRAF